MATANNIENLIRYEGKSQRGRTELFLEVEEDWRKLKLKEPQKDKVIAQVTTMNEYLWILTFPTPQGDNSEPEEEPEEEQDALELLQPRPQNDKEEDFEDADSENSKNSETEYFMDHPKKKER